MLTSLVILYDSIDNDNDYDGSMVVFYQCSPL